MAWGDDWSKGVPPVWPQPKIGDTVTIVNNTDKPVQIGWDIGSGKDETAFVKLDQGKVVEIKVGEEAKKEILKNVKPTHDPYTNPNAFLYYECNCGQRLDPHVKSFAALNNAAMASDWKIRFGHDGYVPYCAKCGEGIE